MFARELIRQLDEIREVAPCPSDEEPQEGETVVGVLDEDHQRLWTLMAHYKEKGDKLHRQVLHFKAETYARRNRLKEEEEEGILKVAHELSMLREQQSVIQQILATSIKTKLNNGRHMCNLRIGKNWSVILGECLAHSLATALEEVFGK